MRLLRPLRLPFRALTRLRLNVRLLSVSWRLSLLRSRWLTRLGPLVNLLKSPLLKLLKSLPLRVWLLLQVLLRPVLLSLLRRRRKT